MAVSALKGAGLRTYSLTFKVPSSGTETGTLGNTRPKLTTTTVEALLKPSSNPVLREQVGADAKELAFTGRAVDPSALPSGIADGSTASLTINGRPGTFTITLAFPSSVAEVDTVLGQPFLGKWKAS